MNLVDVLVVLAALASALAGFRHGFLIAITSLGGFLGGAYLGLRLAPVVLADAPRVSSTTIVAVVVVLGSAAIGQVLGALLGRSLRNLITWQPGRLMDASAGAMTGVLYVLVLSWAIGIAVASAGLPVLGPLVRGSSVLAAVDGVLPESGPAVLGRFTQLLDRNDFPLVFGAFDREAITPVGPLDADSSLTGQVLATEQSLVRVQGNAPSCSRDVTGSGFVIAPEVVATNAHVLAGVEQPFVSQRDGTRYEAFTVLFDPSADLAVLRVPGLDAPALAVGGEVGTADAVATAGYPGGGDLRIGAARIRSERDIVGPDIYGTGTVTREVYALRATVNPGDSGGPLLAPHGSVVGVVFAASIDDPETAYAFTMDQARPVLERGLAASDPVSTGPCA